MPTSMRSPTSSSDPVFLIVRVPWLFSRMALSPRPSRKLVTHALLRSAAHGRKLGPTAGALPVSARFIPRVVKKRSGFPVARCSALLELILPSGNKSCQYRKVIFLRERQSQEQRPRPRQRSSVTPESPLVL